MTTSQDISNTKRSASPADGNDKKKLRKVVVKSADSTETNEKGEKGDGLKQQTLGAETDDKEGKEKEEEEQEVIVIDEEEEESEKDKKGKGESNAEDKKEGEATEADQEKFASREEAGKDKGGNAQPGQEPHLDLSKEDFKRKHGEPYFVD